MKLKKLTIIFVLFLCSVLLISPINVYADSNDIYLGGYPSGFSIKTRGAYIIGLCDVVGVDSIDSPAKDAGIVRGDIIYKIEDVETNNAKDIENALENKTIVKLKIYRKGELIEKNIKTAKDNLGNTKLGVFIRDSINGIGTVTFIKSNVVASLGHPVLDEQLSIAEVIGGEMYNCLITGNVKGEKGKPGELKGVILKNSHTGNIYKNSICGVYAKQVDKSLTKDLKKVQLGTPTMGDAQLYTTIKGNKPALYDISIIKTSLIDKDSRNLVIKITDDELLKTTGGIVQGMSGSPILQNGKLVGAVTHVFINDPTRGYGINIDNMINNI